MVPDPSRATSSKTGPDPTRGTVIREPANIVLSPPVFVYKDPPALPSNVGYMVVPVPDPWRGTSTPFYGPGQPPIFVPLLLWWPTYVQPTKIIVKHQSEHFVQPIILSASSLWWPTYVQPIRFIARDQNEHFVLVQVISMNIGDPIGGGTFGRILFEGVGPVLADSSNLAYNSASSTLNLVGSIVQSVSSASLPIGTFGYSCGCPPGTIPWGLLQNTVDSNTPTLVLFQTSDGILGYIQCLQFNGISALSLFGGSGRQIALAPNLNFTTAALLATTANRIGVNQNVPGAQLHATSGAIGTIATIVQGASGQTANLQEWQTNAGTPVASIAASGGLALGSGFTVHRTPVSNSYSILTTDYLLGVTSTAAAYTLTLPTASGVAGQTYVIKDESGGAATHNITLATTSAQTIDGAATKAITTNYGTLKVYSDGTNWFAF